MKEQSIKQPPPLENPINGRTSLQMYDLNVDEAVEEIRARGARRVVIQLPDGLKPLGFELCREIEAKTGVEVYLTSDPCYGACDLAWEAMNLLQAELTVHCGHAEIPHLNDGRTIYLEARSNVSIEKPLKEALKMVEGVRVGLLATVQHIHLLERASRILRKLGKEVYVGRAGGKLRYDGQVLGCDFTAATSISEKVDFYLVIAGGVFHAVGVEASTGKPAIAVDPYLGRAVKVSDRVEKLMKIRMATRGRMLEAKRIGVLVSLKPGQMRVGFARKIKSMLEREGKECVLIAGRELTGLNLNSFSEIDLFINTACPRIAWDDREGFMKPILNAEEAVSFLESKQKRLGIG